MKVTKSFIVLAGLGLFLLVAAAPLTADEAWRTPLTLTEPTEIPGTVLEPGKYMVLALDTKETRMVVQFRNADETKVFATVMAIPNYRVKIEEGGQFTYFQRSEGSPQALKTWFYPANNFGIEFVYPREEAVKIAQASRQDVYAAPSAKPEAHEQVIAVTPQLKERPVTESAPTAREPETMTAEKTAKTKTLPKTGSHLPIVLLAGLAALGAAGTLRLFARV